jgi:hypothetical protein
MAQIVPSGTQPITVSLSLRWRSCATGLSFFVLGEGL